MAIKPPAKQPQILTNPPQDDEGDEGEATAPRGDQPSDDAENQRINAIVTSRVKRELRAVNTTLAAIQASIAALAPKPPADDEDDEGEEVETPVRQPKAPAVVAATDDPIIVKKMNKLSRELADERKARQQAEKDRADELEKARKSEMKGTFQSALSELGVTDRNLLRSALSILDEDGLMVRDDRDEIRFKFIDRDGLENLLDPRAGLKQWIAKDGKAFVPAVDAGGSGTGAASKGVHTKSEIQKMSPRQVAEINLQRACSGLPPIGKGGES